MSSSELKLKWTGVKGSDLDHYNIYSSTKSKFTVSPGKTPASGTSDTNSYSSTGLHASTKYYFKVAAVDKSGNIGKISSTKNGKTNALSSNSPSSGLAADEIKDSLIADPFVKNSSELNSDQSHEVLDNNSNSIATKN